MKVKFHPEAREEFDDTVDFYGCASAGLGSRFQTTIENALDRVNRTPGSWPLIGDGVRKYVTRTFPFAIHYTTKNSSF